MRVSIVGLGTVGSTTARVLKGLGHSVSVCDIDKSKEISLLQEGFLSMSASSYIPSVYFFCVPEKVLPEILRDYQSEGLWVIRSTTEPGETDSYSRTYGRHIIHLPEFLRESRALEDALSPSRLLIGQCCPEHGGLIQYLFSGLHCPVVRTNSKTSEMVKLVSNAYLSSLLSFWNEIYQVCQSTGISSLEVGKVLVMDPRISSYGAFDHGHPFGGSCLPKDLGNLIEFVRSLGTVNPTLLEAVQEVNEGMKGGESEGNSLHQWSSRSIR